MTDRCEPPEHLRGVDGWHLLQYRSRLSRPTRDIAAFWHARDGQPVWNAEGRVLMPDDAHYADWHYVGQMATPAEVEALRRERDDWKRLCFIAEPEVATLRADNARLREALTEIAQPLDLRDLPALRGEPVSWRREIARAALKEPTP
jgi:hypothetical protein